MNEKMITEAEKKTATEMAAWLELLRMAVEKREQEASRKLLDFDEKNRKWQWGLMPADVLDDYQRLTDKANILIYL